MKIRLIGFSGQKYSLDIEHIESETIRDIVTRVKKVLNLSFDDDEIMVVCNDKQLYLDDPIPSGCNEIELYPLAHGG
ncbi:hypothetical protein Igag_0298 [Ignisphaera aggregans DSM 17230]|uniref:MoaD/ThiS family protein n=1 Tax=Ignisphaera aggregans (strain DSM 17230 / JCM 13409 / AQ1.S1) TaxID=583356 RepID=E0SQS2_IGNAA|nr:hypothetical protein Igag_0298 [Ignisphaera aggregans DSM 17230]